MSPSAAVERLLNPRSVAIVGASDDPRSMGCNVLATLKRTIVRVDVGENTVG